MATKTNTQINGYNYYRITVDLGINAEGERVRKQFLGKSKKEAEKKRDEFFNNVQNGIMNKKVYLAKGMHDWFWEVVKNNEDIKVSTFNRNYRTYNKYLKNCVLSSYEIKKITTMDIQKYYNSLHKTGVTSTTLKMINKVLKSFMYYCMEVDIINKNPCTKVVIPRDTLSKQNKEITTFTGEEIKKIINAPETSKIKCIALISLGTGMRLGEVLALTTNDIDYKNNLIHVNKTLVTTDIFEDGTYKSKTTTFIDTPKTESSIRDLKLTKDLRDVIMTALKIKEKEMLSAAANGFKYNLEYKNIIFTNRYGELLKRNSVEGLWKQFLQRCKINHKKFHTLRHTYATLQYENDVQLYTISKLLGHSNSKTTEIYAHVSTEAKDKAIDTLSNFMV